MSTKAVVAFSIWTSVWSAVFYHFYNMLPFGIGWIMFVCLGIFFGMGLQPKHTPSLLLCAYAGMAWGQFDFLLIWVFGLLGIAAEVSVFLSIVIGTAITMIIHLGALKNTPLRYMPVIFAGVCLTFSQGGGNIPGLAVTFAFGMALCAVCFAGQAMFVKKFPQEAKAEKDQEKYRNEKG